MKYFVKSVYERKICSLPSSPLSLVTPFVPWKRSSLCPEFPGAMRLAQVAPAEKLSPFLEACHALRPSRTWLAQEEKGRKDAAFCFTRRITGVGGC